VIVIVIAIASTGRLQSLLGKEGKKAALAL